MLRKSLRQAVDPLLKSVGLKLVNRHRTPCGFAESLAKAASSGVHIEQVIDIGASDGKWTRQCMDILPHAKYCLIEAREVHRAALEGLQATRPDLQFWISGVGATEERLEMFEHGNQTSLFRSEYASKPACSTCTIDIRPLESIIAPSDLTGPTLIKMDVQGAELEVLDGSRSLLENPYTQLLLIEVSTRKIYSDAPLAHEIIGRVAQSGFRIFDVCSYCPRPYDNTLAQCDILFAREDSKVFEYEGWE